MQQTGDRRGGSRLRSRVVLSVLTLGIWAIGTMPAAADDAPEADAGVAVGPVGAGVSGGTANLSADIISFSRSKGLYGGVSLQGAVVGIRDDWNRAYYGKAVTPSDILVRREVVNPEASGLIEAVSKAAGGG